jgi:hypothetical protein
LPAPIPEHKLNAIAHMAVSGNDVEQMAQVTSLKVDTIKRLLRGENQKFVALREAHERKLFASEVLHLMWMRDQQADCQQALTNAIRGGDKRLAAEYAWKILETLRPKRQEPDKAEITVNVRAEAEFKQTVLDIGKEFIEIKEFLSKQDPNKHVLTGEEALPRAIAATAPVREAENVKVEIAED